MFNFELLPLTWQILGAASLIFVMRLIGVAIGTLRMLFMIRRQKIRAALTGFVEVLVYLLAIGQVVNNLGNIWNVLGYCLGFAAGTLVGMWLDELFSIGFARIAIISISKGVEIVQQIRQAGFGATSGQGTGRDGQVSIIFTTVLRREVKAVCHLVEKIDKDAFITVDEVQHVQHGYLHLET